MATSDSDRKNTMDIDLMHIDENETARILQFVDINRLVMTRAVLINGSSFPCLAHFNKTKK